MGYQTDFNGEFTVTPTLKPEHWAYLVAFNKTRRMTRNEILAEQREDPVRIAAGLPVGEDGEYFVGESGHCGQNKGPDVTDANRPPCDQPGLWCQWTPGCGGTVIEHDGGEKFYHYVEWLEYLIANFLGPWGYKLNGSVHWQGGEDDDRGMIFVKDNAVEAVEDEITNPGPSWDKSTTHYAE